MRFAQIAEEFAVKTFIAQLVVKALDMPILPWAPGLNVKRLDLLSCMQVAINSGPSSVRRCSGTP